MKKYLILILLFFASISQAKLEFAGIPLLNFNSDEAIGYGANIAIYDRDKSENFEPYIYLVQPNIFTTTGGRTDLFIFFDSPHLLNGHRISAILRHEKDTFSPFYGIGNSSQFDEKITDENSDRFIKNYYRFGRTRTQLTADLQRSMPHNLRFLIGFGLFQTSIETYENSIVEQEKPIGVDGGWTNYLKLGVIHDTRDRESAPTSGLWSEAIVEVVSEIFQSDYKFTRFTLTDRRYFPLIKDRLVYANRIVYETIVGDEVPFYEMSMFAGSYSKEEALGGSKSIRGILRNRLIGKTKLFANLELRWKLIDFKLLKQNFSLATNFFVDAGRVWNESFAISPSGYHATGGAGVRLVWNDNFIIATDLGHSEEVPIAVYIGLGYLY